MIKLLVLLAVLALASVSYTAAAPQYLLADAYHYYGYPYASYYGYPYGYVYGR